MQWATAVTTVPKRFKDPLPRTLASLSKAGFPEPWLSVDDITYPSAIQELCCHSGTKLAGVTSRQNIRPFGHWWLTAVELYIRNPQADRYAIFQDDFLTYPNLRTYLERWYPKDGYLNLITNPSNTKPMKGWYKSNQLGKGAVGLIFNNEMLRTLFAAKHFIEKPKCAKRGWRSIDGGIVDSMRNAGKFEYVHNPSLLLHTGFVTTFEKDHAPQPPAPTFRGETFDALQLLEEIPCPGENE